MNLNRHLEDDDLAAYAMGLLTEPEAAEVARQVAASDEVRGQLAEVQARLSAYAQISVEMQAVPEGSLERLMGRITQEKRPARPDEASVVGITGAAESKRRRNGLAHAVPWVGWALAAGLAITAGKFYQDRGALHQMLTAQTGQVVHMSADTIDVYRERQALQMTVGEQTKKIEQLTAESATERSTNEGLRSAATEQAKRLDQQSTRMGQITSQQATAEQEENALRQRLAAQSSQVAELTTEAARSREVLEALTDRTALRVTLTRPESQAAPTGRATYLASRGTLVFFGSNLAALRPNKVYELWLMPADGSKPVPVGTFAPDAGGSATLVYPQLASAVPAKGFAITVENAGGALTPTLPIVLAGSGS